MTKPSTFWEKKHNSRLDAIAQMIETLFQTAADELTRLAASVPHDPTKPFQFSRYPQTSARLQDVLTSLAKNTSILIERGVTDAWEMANAKNDELVDTVFADAGLSPEQLSNYRNRNVDALKAFQSRKAGGLMFSDRVWKYSGQQFKSELEMALDVGLGKGKSAAQLSRDIRQSLQDPDRLFRRVRDSRGQLHLSKNAALFHPGQGVYRSSYKNAMRLARTEINASYRTADYERYQQLDFVVGIEVKRSNNKTSCDVCDALAGRYPKDYKFVGNHPQCRCYTVTILATAEEMRRMTRQILDGEDTEGFKSVNEVTDVPDGFKEWIGKNTERIQKGRSVPFFVQDNFKQGQIAKGLTFTVPPALDLRKLIKGAVPTDKELKTVIMEFARIRPENFRRGLESVSILTSKNFMMQHGMNFDPRSNQWTGKSYLSLSKHLFRVGGGTFSPVEEFRGALTALKAGKPLTFDQEYSMSALWHEILHAKTKTPPRKLDIFRLERMEQLNEFMARHTYGEFLDVFGAKPIHQAAILDKGYGYTSLVSGFRAKLAKAGVAEVDAVRELMPVLMGDYGQILQKVEQYMLDKTRPKPRQG